MKKATICLIAITFFVGCRSAATPVSISKTPINSRRMPSTNLPLPPQKPVEELSWTFIDNDTIKKLGDYKGKVLVLDFWATYCPPCIKEIPHLNKLKKQYGANGLEIIGLNVGGEDDKPEIPDFRKRLEIDYPLAFPEDAVISTLMGSDDRIPQTVIFDRDGKLVEHFVSYDETVSKQIDEAIKEQFPN
ncbi:MAG: TlpA family protein disulfide reductase [Pyrinomonadaceae bacterium]